ncbi:TPA: hypothetical protein QFG22_000399 [Enterococcus faecium]
MNRTDILNSFDYDTRGNEFKEVSEIKMREILEDYYFTGKTIKKIIEENQLKIKSSVLYKNFPKLTNKTTCKYDQHKMYVTVPSRENLKYFSIDVEKFECSECGHRNIVGCMCNNCQDTYRRKIKQAYSLEEKVSLESCCLKDRLALATLLQYTFTNSCREEIGPYNKYLEVSGSPFFDARKELERLITKGIIGVSPSSDLSSFPIDDQFPNRFYSDRVKYKLNLAMEDEDYLFSSLKYFTNTILIDDQERNDLWRYIVINELIRLTEYQMEEFAFFYKHKNDKDKLFNLFNRLVETLIPSQIYAMIWLGIRKADNLKKKDVWKNYKYHHVDFIITNIEQSIMWRFNNQEEIKSYNYPNQVEPILYTKIYFEQILLRPDWFVEKVPNVAIGGN